MAAVDYLLLSVPTCATPTRQYLSPLRPQNAFHMISHLASPPFPSSKVNYTYCCWDHQINQGGTKEVIERSLENMPRRGRSLSGVDRNALERERRLYMKELFSRLAFLLPTPHFKPSLPKLLDQATTHVKQLGERIEMLKQKKQLLECSTSDEAAGIRDHMMGGSWSPVLTVRDLGSLLEVCVKSGSNKKFMLHQVIQILEEEAAQVVALSYSNVGDRIFYTINAQAVSPRIGIETSRVHERLKELIF